MCSKCFIRWFGSRCFALFFCFSVEAQDSARNKVLPDHLKLQFAGEIGFLSIGAGYQTKNKKWEADLYYGYVPKSIGGVTIHSLTAKLTSLPFKPFQRNQTSFNPLSAGVLINYTFGKQYFGFTPENYPFEYYGFPTSVHAGAFIGGQVNKNIKGNRTFRSIGLYYEIVTYDVLLVSYLGNKKSLSIPDILSLGLGIRTSF
jgi:hypothetical protein